MQGVISLARSERWTESDVAAFVLRILPLYGMGSKLDALGPATIFVRMGLTAVQSHSLDLLSHAMGGATSSGEHTSLDDSTLHHTLAERVQAWMEIGLQVLQEEPPALLEFLQSCAENGTLARFIAQMISQCSNEAARAVWQVYLDHLPGGGKVAIEPSDTTDSAPNDDADTALREVFQSLKLAWQRWPALNIAPWTPFLSDLRHHYDLCQRAGCWPGDAQHDSSSPVHAMAHAMAGTSIVPTPCKILRMATPTAASIREGLFGHARVTLVDRGTWGLAQYYCLLLALPFTQPCVPTPLLMLPVWPQLREAIPADQLSGVAKIYARGSAFTSTRDGPGGDGQYDHAYPLIRHPKLPQCIAMLAQNAAILGDKQRFVLASFLAQCAPPECESLEEALVWVRQLAQQVEVLPPAKTLMAQRGGMADAALAAERMEYMRATFLRDRGSAKIYSCARIINTPIEGRADVFDRVICPHHSVGDIEDLAKVECAVHCGVARGDAMAARWKHHSMATLWANTGQ